MTDVATTADPTGAGLMIFLDYAIQKGYLKETTGQSRKSSVKEVLSATEGAEAWEAVNLDGLDVEDTLRRFVTLRAMKFSPGSLATYQQRFQSSVEMYRDFRANPSGWKPKVATRKRATPTPVAVPNGESADRVVVLPEPASNDGAVDSVPRPHRSVPIIKYPFPLRDGVLASVELPADLSQREAARLAAFIGSLAIEDRSTDANVQALGHRSTSGAEIDG